MPDNFSWFVRLNDDFFKTTRVCSDKKNYFQPCTLTLLWWAGGCWWCHSPRQNLWGCQTRVPKSIHLGRVVQKVDNAILWINLYSVDKAIGFLNTYPLDSDLSSE